MELPGASITAARKKVYPLHVAGRYRHIRNIISFVLQVLLFATPWLQYQGRQAVLFDLPGRKLFLWGLVLHPQDTYFLHILLISAAITLFVVSAVAGRMWCGYACPQTILTQSFIRVERFWEGDRAARIRLDKAPWTASKILRKLGKRTCWVVMGAFLGLTFAGYFLPIRTIMGELLHAQVSTTTLVTVGFFTALSLFEFGYFREQFCNYLCPYARFQGAMLDADSLIVGYDEKRGEPRGKAKEPDRGSCVNCTMCVQACPMGIDIRTGLQLECIACAACIDACDEVMDKVNQPRGLIRYTSLNALSGSPTKILRPRVLAYTLLLVGLGGLLAYLVLTRTPLSLDAVRVVLPGGQLAVTTPDGQISNVFKIHLVNRLAERSEIWLEASGLPGAQLMGITNPLPLESGDVSQTQVIVLVPANTPRGIHPFHFLAHDQSNLSTAQEATFVVP